MEKKKETVIEVRNLYFSYTKHPFLTDISFSVNQGEIFGTTTSYKPDTSVKSLLHFEVYYKDNAIDPENLYTMSVSDLK